MLPCRFIVVIEPRGVEGSCAKRLNIEFYTVVILLIIIVINISILSPVPLSFEA